MVPARLGYGAPVSTAVRAAVIAGTLVRILRPLGRLLPGLAGAVLASVGAGQVAGHVFGRGLAPWVGCVVAAGFLVRIGAEVNAAPPRPPRHEDDAD